MESPAFNLGDGNPSPKLRVSKRFCLVPVNEERVVARTEGGSFSLRGKKGVQLLAWLLPKLDGRRTFEDLVAQSGEFLPDEVAGVLASLLEHGIVEDAGVTTASSLSGQERARYDEQRTFFSHFSPIPDTYQTALKEARVVVVGAGAVGSQVALCLVRSGVGRITLVDDGRVNDRLVNSGTFYDRTEVGKFSSEVTAAKLREANPLTRVEWSAEPITCGEDVEAVVREANLALLCLDKPATSIWDWMNEACLKRKVLWTSAHIEDFAGVIGPSVVPFQTPCYKCYDLRRKSNLDPDDFEEAMAWEKLLRERGGRLDFATGTLPAFAPLLGAVTAIEVLKMLTGFEKPTAYGAVWEIHLPTLKVVLRPLLKMPRCPACSKRQRSVPR